MSRKVLYYVFDMSRVGHDVSRLMSDLFVTGWVGPSFLITDPLTLPLTLAGPLTLNPT